MTKSDPIGTEYYIPLRTAEAGSDYLFLLSAALSIATLQVDKTAHETVYDIVQSLFALSVLSAFVIGLAIRLYWSTRAHSRRVADFLSHAFDVSLIDQRSTGYYNSADAESFRRLSASLLENALFTKSILRIMLRSERAKIVAYASVWLFALLNRATDLALVAVAAQIIFSEQIISRWIRMEWLRNRVERVYDDTYNLVQTMSKSGSKEYRARIIEYLLRYETGKAQAGISLSTKIFNKINHDVSNQWKKAAQQLNL